MVASMEHTYLTIAEAGQRMGKSASTIRRLIHAVTEKDSHPDRSAILPTPKEVAAFKKKDENFTWKIREDLVASNFNGALTQEKKSSHKPATDIMTVLQRELELKNQQIEKQWEVIHALNDRLREGNILMGSLQKRLAPPAEQPLEPTVETTVTEASKEDATVGGGRKRKWWRW